MCRYRLEPTPQQAAALLRHCADARYVWNLCVEQEACWRPGRGRMPGFAGRCRQLTDARADNLWLAEGSVIVQQQAIRDHAQAMARFFARLKGREAVRRKDWAEKLSTGLARRFDVIRVEALDITAMTRSAKGTITEPGRNVAAKAGLNRGILGSGWGLLVQRLEDKAPGRVEKVAAAYTSQRCSACGHVDRESRESQARFRCTACGYAANADVNAARNIAAGHAVKARGGDRDTGPVNREPRTCAPFSVVGIHGLQAWEDVNMSQLLPLFPLGTVLFPGMILPLRVFEERYRLMVADLLERPEPRQFGVIAIRKGREVGAEAVPELYDIGCVATVREVTPHPDGRFDLVAVGTRRFRLLRADSTLPYHQGEVEYLPDEDEAEGPADPGARPAGEASTRDEATAEVGASTVAAVQAAFRDYVNALADRAGAVIHIADIPDDPVMLSYVVAAAMIIDLPERQGLLAAPDYISRLRAERQLLTRERAMLRVTTSRPAPDLSREPYSPN